MLALLLLSFLSLGGGMLAAQISIQPVPQPVIDMVIPAEIYLDLQHQQGWVNYLYGSATATGFVTHHAQNLPIVPMATVVAPGQPAPTEILFTDFLTQSKCDPGVLETLGISALKLQVK